MDDVPAIKELDSILKRAIQRRVSDIHLESFKDGLLVRYRSDGILADVQTVLADYAAHVIARTKVLAKLDIAEKRIPQDGKFIIPHAVNGAIDLRVSTFPGFYGEKVVIRILDRSSQHFSLDALGLHQDVLGELRELIRRAHGFFIVTGPTGSGKTTTLYTILSMLRSPTKNIITLEDPVEYTIAGITQGQVHAEIGFDFAKGIRAILRQDPDVMMVGEIRDPETAEMAFRTALTGCSTFSTLHTHDTVGAIIRLLDIGVKAFLINAAVTGILAQRLVRVVCRTCSYEAPLSDAETFYLRQKGAMCQKAFKGRGCGTCAGSGYYGRVPIFELLVMDAKIRAAIHDGIVYDELYEVVKGNGVRSLFHDAMEKVSMGVTSVSEVMRTIV